jgi:hypothetical protein
MRRSGRTGGLALVVVWAGLVAACIGGPLDSGSPAPSASTGSAAQSCRIGVAWIDEGPGARVMGSGFTPDTTVVLTIVDPSGTTTFTEPDRPALRTDIRGAFVFPITAERRNIGTGRFEAAAGGCTARTTVQVTASMFTPDCPLGEPATSGSPASAAYETLVLTDEPAHYWRFEEASGPTAHAAAGEPGTYRGGPGFATPGIIEGSRAVTLDGSDDWIDIPDLALASDFTIEAWVYLCGGPIDNSDAVVGQGGEGPDVNFYEERLRLWDGEMDPAVADPQVEAGRWVQVAVTRHDGALTLYLDAEPVGTGRHEPAFPVAAIGWGNAGLLMGGIDEVAIYDHALTRDRLSAHLAATR